MKDRVVVALDLEPKRPATLAVAGVFEDGQTVVDHYTGTSVVVANGKVHLNAAGPVALLSAK
ncbi:MAG: hypothetical protein ACLGI6_07125 [Gammaproteobacteria bacterium]